MNSRSCGVFNVLEHDIQQTRCFMRFFILWFYLTCVPVQLNFCQSKPQVFERQKPHGSKRGQCDCRARQLACAGHTVVRTHPICWAFTPAETGHWNGDFKPRAQETPWQIPAACHQSAGKTATLTMFTQELAHLRPRLWCPWLCERPLSQYYYFFLFSNLNNFPCAGK